MQRILLVEDEDHLATALKLNLELEGFSVDVAPSGRRARELLVSPEPYDAIVLDVMLPDISGFQLCAKLREVGNFTPVLMLTARGTQEDRVLGLDSGADDYLVKPFAVTELLARLRSLLRRQSWDKKPAMASGLSFGNVVVDFDRHEVSVGGTPLRLTQLELDLLRYFAQNAGRVVGREELLEQVWKLRNYPNTRTVDNFVARLRKYFEPDAEVPRYFVSHRGSGYKFVP
ncbi:MAG: response regulator transcription factor [Deltaproteobacteria bacterium]|nr:response regulator transcription factor [Deltaproteobacteria bacterium]